MTAIITDQEARRAVEFLVHSAAEIAQAKADADRAEKMLKHIKAMAMKDSGESSAAAQLREAEASAAYVQGIAACYEATKHAEMLKAQREAANIKIEAWRSVKADQRAAERGYGSAR